MVRQDLADEGSPDCTASNRMMASGGMPGFKPEEVLLEDGEVVYV